MVRWINEAIAGHTDSSRLREAPEEPPAPPGPTPAPWLRRRTGPIALILGDLELEVPLKVHADRAQLLAEFERPDSPQIIRWRMSSPEIGGFVGHAGRAVAALGARVFACAVVPRRTPAAFELFYRQYGIDTRYATSVAGRCPVRIILGCDDGQVRQRHSSLTATDSEDELPLITPPPQIILADPGAAGRRERAVDRTEQLIEGCGAAVVIGLRIDHRATDRELLRTRDPRVWTFLRGSDARGLMRRLAPDDETDDVDELARRLRRRIGMARLVQHCGPHGAVLIDGHACSYRVQSAAVRAQGVATGAGDTMLAVTLLSAAGGASDRTSLRRGAAAAAAQVAGLPLPASLEALEVE